LGTCIPPEILGPLGYLALKQTKIESINLITGGGCRGNTFYDCPISLREFPRLKRLSWRGLRVEEEFSVLHDVLEQTSHQMTKLELDIYAPELVRSEFELDESDNFFARQVLDLTLGDEKQSFPSLQELSLRGVSFESAEKELAHALSLSSVRSLKLSFCPGWEDFLDCNSRLTPPKVLKTLELHYNIDQDKSWGEPPLLNFLGTFDGLEQLAIGGPAGYETLDVWRSTLLHKSTLKAFVNHQRDISTDDESLRFEEECDSIDGSTSLFEKEMDQWNKDPSLHPFSELNLEFLGMCGIADCLVKIFFLANRRAKPLTYIF
jgi:hypothetical protein